MTEDIDSLVEAALAEGEEVSTEGKTIVDKFAEDLNLQKGDDKISLRMLYDYFKTLYKDNTSLSQFGGTIKKYVIMEPKQFYSVCSVDMNVMNVTKNDIKTAIVRAAYESRKKKKAGTQ